MVIVKIISTSDRTHPQIQDHIVIIKNIGQGMGDAQNSSEMEAVHMVERWKSQGAKGYAESDPDKHLRQFWRISKGDGPARVPSASYSGYEARRPPRNALAPLPPL